MNTLALSACYLGQFVLVLIVLCSVGALLCGPPRAAGAVSRADRAWAWVERYGAGLAASMFVVIVCGLFGGIARAVLLPVFIALTAAGIGRCFIARAQPTRIAPQWDFTPGDKLWFGLALVIYGALNLNVLIGGMCPSMGQDTLWYHLSVPGQWALTGRAAAFPYVMPSNYALGMEAVYAALLLFSNEILCSMIYCQVVLVLLAGMALGSYRFAGWVGATLAMGCIAPFTTTLAPVPPANDSAAVLLLLIGFVRLADSIRDERAGVRGLLLTGFVFGSAIAVKITSIIFCAPIVFFWLAFSFGQVRARRLLAAPVLLGAAMAIAYAPWAVRGFQYGGNPVFPLAKTVFPVRAEYRAMAERSAALNSSYPLTPKGMIAAFADLPEKLAYLGPDVMFWLVLMSALTLIFSRGRHARFLGWSLLGFYGGFFAMKGRNEIGRYFGMGYPVAAPAVAMAFAFLRGQMQRQGKTTRLLAPVLAFALIASATGIYARNQLAQAQWPVFQWKFRPIVTRQAIDAFAQHAEIRNYILYSRLQNAIEPEARVFLADEVYPYYLKRTCIWGDEVSITAFQNSWSRQAPEQMHAYLTAHDVRYVICLKNDIPLLQTMERKGLLRPIPFAADDAKNLGLWAIAR